MDASQLRFFQLNILGEEKVFQIEFFDIFNQQLIREVGWIKWKPVISLKQKL